MFSRIEDILQRAIDDDDYNVPAQSRIEELLIELTSLTPSGSGVSEAKVSKMIQTAIDKIIDSAPSDADTLNKLNIKIENDITITTDEFIQLLGG